MFRDRTEAGRLLGNALTFLKGKDAVILGVPRGGVVVAKEVAAIVGAPLDLIVTRKIGAPGNPELAVGAVTQEGKVIPNPELVEMLQISADYLSKESARQAEEINRRMKEYRGDKPYPRLDGKIVVIVDDGIATGYTTQAAVQSVKMRNATMVIVAVPVAPRESISELSKIADRVICLSTPDPFYAIGQFYTNFEQVDDTTVKEILRTTGAR